MPNERYGLGRLESPDARDQNFLMAAPPSTRTARFWWGYRLHLDQGNTPQCVAYSWSHFLVDSPDPHPAVLVDPAVLYHEAQTLDEWPGEDYEGTSVRAGAKALVARSLIYTGYTWAFDLNTIIQNVLEVGPVVFGTNWYYSMFTPGSDNYIRINDAVTGPDGDPVAGGHAYKVDGVNVPKRFFRMKQSWALPWGHHGFARISFDDAQRLIEAEQGEACMAVESVH